jgi:hypothetical protein
MSELVGADVASLRKAFAAFFALEGLFACVSPLMGLESWLPVSLFALCITVAWSVSFQLRGRAYLEVALLRKSLAARGLLADLPSLDWLVADRCLYRNGYSQMVYLRCVP